MIFKDKRTFLLLFCLSFYLLLFSKIASAEDVILNTQDESIYLGPHLSYLEDKNGIFSIYDIQKNDFKSRFRPCECITPGFGFTSSTYWFKFTLYNPLKEKLLRYLEIEYPLLDHISLFVPTGENEFISYSEGDRNVFSKREIPYRNFVFRLSIPPQKRLTYYLKVKTSSSLNVPIRLYSENAFIDKIESEETALGVYFGILFAMLVYNLILFFTIRESVYLYYISFVIFNFLFQLTLTGIAFKYLWPTKILWANKSVPLFILLAYLFGTAFTTSILNTSKNTPVLDKILKFLLVVSGCCASVSFILPYSISIRIATDLSITVIIHIIAGLTCLIKGYRPARYYVLAWGVSLGGIALYALKTIGLLPNNFFTIWGLQIGSAWEVIFLSMALADRLNLLQRERDRIKAEYTKRLEIANRQLEEFAKTLEEKVIQRTKELEASNKLLKKQAQEMKLAEKRAEEASRAKSEFLANMSHEIRTPLNAITGITALALQMDIPEKLRGYLNVIKASASTLLNLVNDILDLSKIEAGKMEIEKVEFNLQDVLDNIGNMFAEIAAEKGIEFIIDMEKSVPNWLLGDPVRLGQLLTNFVSNAMKFTDRGHVILRCSCERVEDNRAFLSFKVIDTGIGIEKGRLDDLFDMFTQADSSTTRRFGGTGLGLTICKRLSALMGGSIHVESKIGKGSIFSFNVALEISYPKEKKDISFKEIDIPQIKLITKDLEIKRALSNILLRLGIKGDFETDGSFGKDTYNKDAPLFVDIPSKAKDEDLSSLVVPQERAIYLVPFGMENKILNLVSHERAFLLKKPVREREVRNGILWFKGLYVDRATSYKKKEIFFKGVRALVVEDNEINQMVAREILEKLGLSVDFASNGLEAVQMVSSEYDIVFMDIQMPEMDGYEATKIIRQNASFKKLPIIAMTASVFKEDRMRCFESGMNDFVMKPVTPEALGRALLKWIDKDKVGYREVDERPYTKEKDPDISIPGIDFSEIDKRFSGKRELYFELLEKFFQEYGELGISYSSLKREGIEPEEKKALKRFFHTLKGVSSNLGLYDISESSLKIEGLIEKGEYSKALEGINKLESDIQELLNILETRGVIKRDESQAFSARKNNLDIKNLLFKLDELLELNDIECEGLWSKLREKLKGHWPSEEIEKIDIAISNFDFDEARRLISTLNSQFKLLEGSNGRHNKASNSFNGLYG